MRSLTLIFTTGLFLAIGACSSNDGAATDDSSEINEGTGVLEKQLNPTIDVPKSDLIGQNLEEIYTKALGDLKAPAAEKQSDGCSQIEVRDPQTKEVVVERVTCKTSDVVRTFNDDGSTKEEHADLNKDGKVDRYTGADGSVVQYVDSNFDGKIDGMTERVDLLKDFSLKGYEETDYPKSAFLYRVRFDRDYDGKFEHESMTARGLLKPSGSE
jgi:hypothetical protein